LRRHLSASVCLSTKSLVACTASRPLLDSHLPDGKSLLRRRGKGIRVSAGECGVAGGAEEGSGLGVCGCASTGRLATAFDQAFDQAFPTSWYIITLKSK